MELTSKQRAQLRGLAAAIPGDKLQFAVFSLSQDQRAFYTIQQDTGHKSAVGFIGQRDAGQIWQVMDQFDRDLLGNNGFVGHIIPPLQCEICNNAFAKHARPYALAR